jgi:hypothetical protein
MWWLPKKEVVHLGFFFDAQLTWTHHVEVMCNRAHASIKALQLLGNSVQGLDHAKWRLVYNMVCLPVLTYGSQLWFTGKQKTLVKKLQMVQNEAVRVIVVLSTQRHVNHSTNSLPSSRWTSDCQCSGRTSVVVAWRAGAKPPQAAPVGLLS